MGTESELRQEIADERRQLTEAVASLRTELDHAAERGKQIGVVVGAALAARMLIKRLRRDD
ncbi:MAG TPA: hypothetical protein VFN33_01460 [Gaiellaceae bacterium]|jgi:hypothetical protein|nr:hypothetical protein [Gaiellaceae bacterium]